MKLLTAQEVAKILGVKRATIYQWKWKRVDFPFVKVGRSLRVDEGDLHIYLESQKMKSKKR